MKFTSGPSPLRLEHYSDPDFFQQEVKKVFHQGWQFAGHQGEIPDAGDYFTLKYIDEPLVFLRGEDGKVRGFYNICIHRGFSLFKDSYGTSNGKGIRCAYHGWSYRNDGTLISPEPIDKNCSKLREIRVEVLFGFIFFTFESEISSVDKVFPDFPSQAVNMPFENLRKTRQRSFTDKLDVNWKVFLENSLEAYHVGAAHPGLRSLVGTDFQFIPKEKLSIMKSSLQAQDPQGWSERIYYNLVTSNPADFPQAEWHYYYLFPNVQIAIYPEQCFYLHAIPINAERTLVRGRYLTLPKSSRKVKAAQYLNVRIGRTIYWEDLQILQNMKDGFKSKTSPSELYLKSPEEDVTAFFQHCLVSSLKGTSFE